METVPKPDYTVAADPEVIPLGSSIVIEGTVYHVERMSDRRSKERV